MNNQIEQAGHNNSHPPEDGGSYDYTYVHSVGRIALYDDLLSAPRITEIKPAPTSEFIENLASNIYEQAKKAGGTIPYTVIREVSENFIHAKFAEVTVSVLDNGNTIRFTDQGPGIVEKEKAQIPGFTSAVEPMKDYIRGVGSGLPIVKEYLSFSQGTITIEDNLRTGAVVTISLKQTPSQPQQQMDFSQTTKSPSSRQQNSITSLISPLSQRERDFLPIFLDEGALGVTDLSRLTNLAMSSTYSTLSRLEQAGLIEKTVGQKRILTDLGYQVANSL